MRLDGREGLGFTREQLAKRAKVTSAYVSMMEAGEASSGAPNHGELMHGARRDGRDNAITWHLIHVLGKLERQG